MQTTPKGRLLTGIRGRCPRCGEGKLFRGFLKLASRCDVCGLNYGFADPADGPAFFAMTALLPDAHWGYGFPIGGVAAFDPDQGGVVSSGGVVFGILCLTASDIVPV